MANETTTALKTDAADKKTPCGCGGASTDVTKPQNDDNCPCKRRERMKKMLIGGVILVVLGVAAYGAWKMGYFDKAMSFVKDKIKKIA